MAEIIANEGGKQKGKKRAKRHSSHIDMTPMVDLACLLLTFFMLTSQLSKPKVMEILLPERRTEDTERAPQIDEKKAMNIILIENNRILWYNGLADPTKESLPVLNETDFSDDGIRKVLLQRNRDLFTKIYEMNLALIDGTIDIPKDSIKARKRKMYNDDRTGPVVLIKAGDKVKYNNVVDIIDEMTITNIARYALVDINVVEKKMVAAYLADRPSGAASNK